MNLSIKRIAHSPIKVVIANGRQIGAFYGKYYYSKDSFTNRMKQIIQAWEDGNGNKRGT